MKTRPWRISRGFVGPFGRIQYRPLFIVEAPNEDKAIEIAAHRVRGIAILKARELVNPRSFFLHITSEKPAETDT